MVLPGEYHIPVAYRPYLLPDQSGSYCCSGWSAWGRGKKGAATNEHIAVVPVPQDGFPRAGRELPARRRRMRRTRSTGWQPKRATPECNRSGAGRHHACLCPWIHDRRGVCRV